EGDGKMLAGGSREGAGEPLLREIRPGELDRRAGDVHAGHAGAAPGEAGEVDAGAAADLQNRFAPIAVKSDEPQQVVELLEMVFVEVVEEAAGADGMTGDLEVVNVLIPVV